MNTLMSLPMPSAVGSLESYVQSVNRFPLLSEEQEYALATRFKTENDLDAARELVLSHLRVVVSVARGYAGYGLPQADLIQEGNIGLMKAMTMKAMRRFTIWPTARNTSRRAFWKRQSMSACKQPVWQMPYPSWTSAAAISSRRAGCAKKMRQRCMNWPPYSTFPPNASAKSSKKH